MSQLFEKLLAYALLVFFIVIASVSKADGRFSQINLQFDSKRSYQTSFDKVDNSVEIILLNTTSRELSALDQYDESVIRKILITDMGMGGTRIKLFLKDENVRALVSKFDQPFRVVIDLFDNDYKEARDPVTGLPLAKASSESLTPAAQSAGSERNMAHDQGLASPEQASSQREANSTARRLLQPEAESFESPDQMVSALARVSEGPGKAWQEYPVYMSRIQTAAYTGEKGRMAWMKKNAQSAVASSEEMAKYASNLYDFGHEARALVTYQQVLHKSPQIFENDPLHLFKFAEAHFGQGNLSLAEGYYQALIEKHPDSELSRFAALRRLDTAWLRASKARDTSLLRTLTSELDKIQTSTSPELKAQVALRTVFWSEDQKNGNFNFKDIPKLSPANASQVSDATKQAESQKTLFLASSILLNDMTELDRPYSSEVGEFAGNYFSSYKGDSVEPYRGVLSTKLQKFLNAKLQAKVQNGKYLEAISDYEKLPRILKSIDKTPATAWSLAEAYRLVGQSSEAIRLYEKAESSLASDSQKFKAEFYIAVLAGEEASNLRLAKASQKTINKFDSLSKRADSQMERNWNKLKEDQKADLLVTLKADLVKTITAPTLLRTPPRILLESWQSELSSEASIAPTGDMKSSQTPMTSNAKLLANLGKRFTELGDTANRKKALRLLAKLRPKDMENNRMKEVWANELKNLAEEYREDNDFLQAGKLYSLAGSESDNWQGKTEALYKGGLLLYRAGKRDEAIAAFEKAAADNNNQLYQELAKERLNQIRQ